MSPSQSKCQVADLSAGDEIEMYVIASNDGWEWVSATVLDTDPLRVRWWDGGEKAWLRESARIPQIRDNGPETRSRRRLDKALDAHLAAVEARADAERAEMNAKARYDAERARHERTWGEIDG